MSQKGGDVVKRYIDGKVYTYYPRRFGYKLVITDFLDENISVEKLYKSCWIAR
jgi:hypothetical protein